MPGGGGGPGGAEGEGKGQPSAGVLRASSELGLPPALDRPGREPRALDCWQQSLNRQLRRERGPRTAPALTAQPGLSFAARGRELLGPWVLSEVEPPTISMSHPDLGPACCAGWCCHRGAWHRWGGSVGSAMLRRGLAMWLWRLPGAGESLPPASPSPCLALPPPSLPQLTSGVLPLSN